MYLRLYPLRFQLILVICKSLHLRMDVGVGVGVADDLLRVDCPLVVCWVFGGGPRSVGDMLRLRTSRFLAAPARDKNEGRNVKKNC